MKTSIANVIRFDPDAGPLVATLNFTTLLLCPYRIDLRESGKNASVPPYPVTGDNSNTEQDEFTLPGTAGEQDGRRLWLFTSVIDQTGEGGEYSIDIEISQDGRYLERISTGRKHSDGGTVQEVMAVSFRSRR